jgi:hypothetical protein
VALSGLRADVAEEFLNGLTVGTIRNYSGQKVGLKNMTASEIGEAVNVPEVFVTVFFESKSEH